MYKQLIPSSKCYLNVTSSSDRDINETSQKDQVARTPFLRWSVWKM